MPLHHVAHDRQAKTGPTRTPRPALVDSCEPLKHHITLISGETRPIIGNRQHHINAILQQLELHRAIGVANGKTTAARLLPIPGKKPGDIVAWGGLLGDAIVQEVNRFSPKVFIVLGGRIPAPIQSLRN